MTIKASTQPQKHTLVRVALFPALLLALAAALLLAVVLSISVGAVSLPFGQVVRIVLQPLFPGLITAD